MKFPTPIRKMFAAAAGVTTVAMGLVGGSMQAEAGPRYAPVHDRDFAGVCAVRDWDGLLGMGFVDHKGDEYHVGFNRNALELQSPWDSSAHHIDARVRGRTVGIAALIYENGQLGIDEIRPANGWVDATSLYPAVLDEGRYPFRKAAQITASWGPDAINRLPTCPEFPSIQEYGPSVYSGMHIR